MRPAAFVGIGFAEEIALALEELLAHEGDAPYTQGKPGNLTLVDVAGQGDRKPGRNRTDVTGANFRANWVALGRGGSDKFGEWRDLGADHAEARTQVFIE